MTPEARARAAASRKPQAELSDAAARWWRGGERGRERERDPVLQVERTRKGDKRGAERTIRPGSLVCERNEELARMNPRHAPRTIYNGAPRSRSAGALGTTRNLGAGLERGHPTRLPSGRRRPPPTWRRKHLLAKQEDSPSTGSEGNVEQVGKGRPP